MHLFSFGAEESSGAGSNSTWYSLDTQSILGLSGQGYGRVGARSGVYPCCRSESGRAVLTCARFILARTSTNLIVLQTDDASEDAYPLRIRGHS